MKHIKAFLPALGLALLLAAPAHAAQVKLRSVSVHDPSVLRAPDGRFYIYGSHMQAAYSDDLISWQMFSRLDKCTLQPDYANEFHEALTWAQAGTFWAPDVVRLADGRYSMYYCCCEGSSPLSALGLAVSDRPEGPFEHVAILLKSGGPGYDATKAPNAIDPCVFFDASGERLYMAYGSYSGGIFLLELDPATGLVKDGQEPYGTHLLGGNHSRIEAPYVVYNPQTGYYYLFLSYGGLEANDGYNVRVCRARSPEGPYEDAAGHDMRECACAPGNFWNDEDVAPYGTKLMGGYLFAPLSGENSDRQNAVRSPGHNSVCFDEATGRFFILHHARFAATGERYVVQVRELYWNDAGWPMISPALYAGDAPEGERAQMSGRFKLLRHGQDVNKTEHASVEALFSPDGAISGAVSGSFETGEDGRVTLTVDGVTYTGRCFVGYDDVQDAFVTCVTALSEGGEALWAMRATGQDG